LLQDTPGKIYLKNHERSVTERLGEFSGEDAAKEAKQKSEVSAFPGITGEDGKKSN